MKKIFLLTLVFAITLSAVGQTTPDWNKFKWLIGDWVGEGTGKPGEGKGGFSLKEDLDGKILVRKNHSEYPAQNGRPANVHDDLMIVYPDNQGTPANAVYFDNEGHHIRYAISYAGDAIVLLSEKSPNTPVFRLTYSPVDKETIDIKFELSQDGEKFMVYTDGKCKRSN